METMTALSCRPALLPLKWSSCRYTGQKTRNPWWTNMQIKWLADYVPGISPAVRSVSRLTVGKHEAVKNNGSGSKREFLSESKLVSGILKAAVSRCRGAIVIHPGK